MPPPGSVGSAGVAIKARAHALLALGAAARVGAVFDAGLRSLYGARAAEVRPRLDALVERWRAPVRAALGDARPLDETDAVLIAYGDHLTRRGEAPLATLTRWCRTRTAC